MPRGLWVINLILISLFSAMGFKADNVINDIDFNQRGEYVLSDKIIVYGGLYKTDIYDQDAVFYIYDTDNQLDKTIVFDDLNYEYFSYLAMVNKDRFIMVCEEYEYDQSWQLPDYLRTVLIEYDFDGNELDKIALDYRPKSYNNIDYTLILEKASDKFTYVTEGLAFVDKLDIESSYLGIFVLQYQGQAFIDNVEVDKLSIQDPGNYNIQIKNDDYVKSFAITVEADVMFEGEKFQEDYLGDLKIFSNGTLSLNGDTYNSGDKVRYPGYYELKVMGNNGYVKTIPFTLLPVVTKYDSETSSQLMENEKIYQPITIYSNGFSMLLNGEPYTSRTIDSTGKYDLTIYGVNNFVIDIPFEILPKITGIEDGGEYESISFSIFGEAYLNDEKVSGTVSVDTPGEYTLKVYSGGQEYIDYHFTIKDTEDGDEDVKVPKYTSIILAGVILLGVYLIFRKK